MNPDTHQDQAVLSQLVGRWEGTFQHRGAADQPFEESPGKSDNRWVMGGRFVEMTLRGMMSGDGWSALFYIGYERTERRYVLVSLDPGDRRITIRRGEWVPDPGRLLLISSNKSNRGANGDDQRQSRIVCDVRTPGELKVEVAEESASGEEFVRFKADYRAAAATSASPLPRQPRRFVIA